MDGATAAEPERTTSPNGRGGGPLRSSRFQNVALALFSLAGAVLLLEVACRLAGFDFARGVERGLANTPIYYRVPTRPVGEGLYARPGPAVWKGNVLAQGFRDYSGRDLYALSPESDRMEITLSYDSAGFRNPVGLRDWVLVFAGDSFTELGYLPHESLVSSRVGAALGMPVKNVAVSFTGPLSGTYFLGRYGRAPGARHAVFVFYEGNDLEDMEREDTWIREFREKGIHDRYARVPQTSFIGAAKGGAWSLARLVKHRVLPMRYHNAYYDCGGRSTGVSITTASRGSAEITQPQRAMLDASIGGWAATARAAGMTPWVVFMPTKNRVLHSHLRHAYFPWYKRFLESDLQEQVERWNPTDLPEYMQAVAERQGVRFVDITPALQQETERCRLTYNPLWDTHLNDYGSAVAARSIANAIRSADAR
jgi:hypothetical protein